MQHAFLDLLFVYVDLSKAFEHAICEVVLGRSQARTVDKGQSLVRAGLSLGRAEELVSHIDSFGPPLCQLGVHAHIVELLFVPSYRVLVFVWES